MEGLSLQTEKTKTKDDNKNWRTKQKGYLEQ